MLFYYIYDLKSKTSFINNKTIGMDKFFSINSSILCLENTVRSSGGAISSLKIKCIYLISSATNLKISARKCSFSHRVFDWKHLLNYIINI